MTEREPGIGEELIRRALAARARSYSPYSHFKVGAAVLGGTGAIYAGTNVENSSYGLTCCAERVAIFSAIAGGERRIDGVAVVTDAATVTPPCGACRQVIAEFGPTCWIVGATVAGRRTSWTLPELLPDAFGPDDVVGPAG